MDVIESKTQTQSPQFAENRERISALVKELKGRLLSVREGGGPERVELHRSRGKMLVRDRIEALLDHGSPFLELSPGLPGCPRYPLIQAKAPITEKDTATTFRLSSQKLRSIGRRRSATTATAPPMAPIQ